MGVGRNQGMEGNNAWRDSWNWGALGAVWKLCAVGTSWNLQGDSSDDF